MFSQHPKWVYFADKLTENAIYCCHKTIITVTNGMEFCEKMIFGAVTKICLLFTFIKWCTIASDNRHFLQMIAPKTRQSSSSTIWQMAYPHLLLTVKWPTGTRVWSHFFFFTSNQLVSEFWLTKCLLYVKAWQQVTVTQSCLLRCSKLINTHLNIFESCVVYHFFTSYLAAM